MVSLRRSMEKRKNNRIDRHRPKKGFYPPKKTYDKNSLVFGVQSVLETLRSEKEIDRILIQREFGHPEIEMLAADLEVPVQKVPIEKLNRVTGKNHQGVIAFISEVNYAKLTNVIAQAYESGDVPLLLVLDRVTDVRNFGAIARTAECQGVNGIVVPARGGAQINSDAMKTSSGALNHLPVCREKDLIKYAEHKDFPIIPCNLCGSQENLQRQSIKAMLTEWDKKTPGRVESIFKSLQNVSPSQLADRNLFDFENLPLDREGNRESYDFSEAVVSSTNIDESLFIDVTNI